MNPSLTTRLLAVSVLLVATAAAAAASAPAPDAERVADRMLAALGGRAAWADTKNTVNDSRQDWDGEPPELRVVITMDFERPRLRIETRAKDLHLIRVIDGDKHWRLSREGKIEPVSAETLASDRRFYAGHIYRTLHRIVARDPALKLSLGREGRLEVHEAGARNRLVRARPQRPAVPLRRPRRRNRRHLRSLGT